jgi:hypothetical protein
MVEILRLSVSNILVSTDPPHIILAVESSHLEFFGICPHELVGQTLQNFEGPLTDSDLLHNAISTTASHYQQSDFSVVLYDRERKPKNMAVSCAPHVRNSGHQNCCLLSLEYSPAITLGEVFEETARAWALIQVEWPHFVDIVNSHFSLQFGFSGSDIIGQNLHRIRPPHSHSTAWRQLLLNASHGIRSHAATTLLTSSGAEIDCDINCIPVVNPPSRAVAHILVLFSPPLRLECATPSASACIGNAASSTSAPGGGENSAQRRRSSLAAGTVAAAASGTDVVAAAAAPVIVDDAYVRRVRRRHITAARRAAAREGVAAATGAREGGPGGAGAPAPACADVCAGAGAGADAGGPPSQQQ